MNITDTPEFIEYATQQIYSRYLGQSVLSGKSFNCIPLDHSFFSKKHVGEFYLQLRSIEDITDEEATKVYKFEMPAIDCTSFKVFKSEKGIDVRAWTDNHHTYRYQINLSSIKNKTAQYLIQSGFVLPAGIIYKGEWFELNLNWQQEKGIIKIK
jgi:hypothetical protein